MLPALTIDWLGRVPYGEALELQEKAVEARRRGAAGDRLLLLEHPAVVTFGRSAREENLRTPRAELAAQGVPVIDVARGGDVTWHGPGQLVGYLVADLAERGAPDVHRHLREIEAALIEALACVGVPAMPREGTTGVFAATAPGATPRKLASIGVGLRGWVSWHGFALNLTTARDAFAAIVPCGLHGVEMSSVARELGREATPALFSACREAVAECFARRWA